ncbi:MAG: hypothetical protein LBT00_06080 [Spirochaetaceae bacterium]|jgi:hypothetical protein|nr:hypothetical protein [Spirochaetaceae bacterium]
MMQHNLALLPPIKRARGYRLYTESKRFVDLYLDGGRAVLGHNPPNVLREMKNAAERSLFAPYPSYYTRRFEKALSLLFPGKSFVVYGSMEAIPPAIREETPMWRPYMQWDGKDVLAILPHPLAPAVFVTEADTEHCRDVPSYPSPVILALTTRAVYDVLHSPERGAAVFGRVDEALADGPWTRAGLYVRLRQRAPDEEWARLFRRFLDAGFLAPPTQRDPLILPGELSDGEEQALAECLRAPM